MNEEGSASNLRVVFAAGGTGGHVFPAVAVAEALKKKTVGARIVFVGTRGKIENSIVPKYGFEIFTIWLSGFQRKSIQKNLMLPLKLIVSMIQARNIMKSIRPKVVICAGGYVSYPVGRAALRAHIPLVLMESNSTPGLVIQKLASRASVVHVAFGNSRKVFDAKAPVYVSGNPIRAEFAEPMAKSDARKLFGLDPNKKTLLVFGGSLGARSINEAVSNAVEEIIKSDIQVLWQTGNSFTAKKQMANVKQLAFIQEMRAAYAAADLVVCRSGATTVAELTYLGIPSVLVPYPYHSDKQQEKNASALLEFGAALVANDNEIGEKLLPLVTSLLHDDVRLATMRDAAWSLGVRDAAERIADNILLLAENHG